MSLIHRSPAPVAPPEERPPVAVKVVHSSPVNPKRSNDRGRLSDPGAAAAAAAAHAAGAGAIHRGSGAPEAPGPSWRGAARGPRARRWAGLYRALQRQWRWGLMAGCAAGVATAQGLKDLPLSYRSECTLQVGFAALPALGVNGRPSQAESLVHTHAAREFYNTQAKVLESRTVFGLAQQRLDPAIGGERAPESHQPSGAAVEATYLEGSELLRVRYEAASPERARAVLGAVVDAYLAWTSRAGASALERRGAQVGRLEGELQRSEAALESYEHENDLLDSSPEQRAERLATEISTLSEALTAARIARAQLVGRVLVEAEAATEPAPPAAPGDDPPGAAAIARSAAPEPDATRQSLAALNLKVDQLESLLREAKAESARVRDLQLGYERLERKREADEALRAMALRAPLEEQEAALPRGPDIRVVDEPSLPARPLYSSFPLALGLGLLGGLSCGLLVAAGKDRFDGRIFGAADVQRWLAGPVLAEFPEQSSMASSGAPPASSAASPSTPKHAEGEDPKAQSSSSSAPSQSLGQPAREAARQLRTALALGSPEWKSITVTSARARAGKSVVARELAIALARVGERVLLLDAGDAREPLYESLQTVQGEAFCAHLARAISEAGGEGAGGSRGSQGAQAPAVAVLPRLPRASRTTVRGLSLLRAGAPSAHLADLLSGPPARELFSRLLRDYDRVVVDAPAADCRVEVATLAQLTDTSLLVLDRGRTTALRAEQARGLLTACSTFAGFVVNRVKA